jgi:hypothetical protein
LERWHSVAATAGVIEFMIETKLRESPASKPACAGTHRVAGNGGGGGGAHSPLAPPD